MVTAEAVRALGGFEGLDDSQLSSVISEAKALVALDVQKLGLNLSEESLDRLITVKACELAARLQRTPVSEGAGGFSASYERLNWRHEYARVLKQVANANGYQPTGGVM